MEEGFDLSRKDELSMGNIGSPDFSSNKSLYDPSGSSGYPQNVSSNRDLYDPSGSSGYPQNVYSNRDLYESSSSSGNDFIMGMDLSYDYLGVNLTLEKRLEISKANYVKKKKKSDHSHVR